MSIDFWDEVAVTNSYCVQAMILDADYQTFALLWNNS